MSPTVTQVYPDPAQVNYEVNMENNVTFICVATGVPPPSITWFRNGIELNSTTDPRVILGQHSNPVSDEEMVYTVNRTLTLGMSEDGDSGSYECLASNDATPAEDNKEFELVVQGKSVEKYSLQ